MDWPLWWWGLVWLGLLAAGVARLWWQGRRRPDDTGYPSTWPPNDAPRD